MSYFKILVKKGWITLYGLLAVVFTLASCSEGTVTLDTSLFVVSVGEQGQVTSLKDKITNTEYLALGQNAPLLSLWVEDSITSPPIAMELDGKNQLITLTYADEVKVGVRYEKKDNYISFEVVAAVPQEKIPGVVWGPYPTTIHETIGEVVGVVRNQDFAIGFQSLGIKTTGGMLTDGEGGLANRKGPASKTEYGSLLTGFALDRSIERTATVWEGHYENMPIPPIEGETVVGSKIALFGCAPENALKTIGDIEVAEGLPHPMIDGQWIKTHPERSKAYFITTFTEETFDELLGYTMKAGMNSIYHGHPFENWGAFDLIPGQFPNGWAGMKALVDKAKAQGVRVGAHTLTTFITPNDPFVTPVPNENLAITGSGTLTSDLDIAATEIPVSTNEFFNNSKFDWMHTVKIGTELIRFRSVSEEAPYKLLDSERGAFGTTAAAHKQGEAVGKLLDHSYKVFFPNYTLQNEMAQNMIDFFNETGVSHMDFDGHEGAKGSGQGTFSLDDFSWKVFRGTKHNLVNGSSMITHNYWHVNHYENWGEPWYGGFRQSQSEYRFNNQPFLEANYLPNMLGWFSLTSYTTVADIEWMLARGAGYHAGFALSANLRALRGNKNTDQILDLIRIWEKARLSGAFTEAHRNQLKDLSKEFHLEELSDTEWKLMMFQDYDFVFEKLEVQPGQPTYAEWNIDNQTGEQPFRALISLDGEEGDTVNNITIEVGNYAIIKIPEVLKTGQELSIDGTGKLTIADSRGRTLKQRKLIDLPVLGKGNHSLQFDCVIKKGNPKVKVKVRLDGKEETVRAK